MENRISKSKFKPKTIEFLRQVERTGQELIVTHRGKPVLKIVPYREEPMELLKSLRNTVLKYDDPTEPIGWEDWDIFK